VSHPGRGPAFHQRLPAAGSPAYPHRRRIPGTGRKIVDGIAAHGVDPVDLALIVLTHARTDHFCAAAQVSRLTGAPIAAHHADLEPYRAGRA
jgi:glyoxylase-like metal-dependent hydrolase (beta-lactamase superfamily II)